jgi:hypothetical protein
MQNAGYRLRRTSLPRTPVNKHGVVYLGVVHPGEDDYRELTDRLFEARERYRSVRATVRHSRHGALATEAINRYEEYGFRHNILSSALRRAALPGVRGP